MQYITSFLTHPPLRHFRINLLSAPLAPHQLPSSPYFILLSICWNSILLSSSSHWTFPRRSTPSDTPRCCPSWLNLTCLSWAGDIMTSQLLWRWLLVHAMHCSVAQRGRLITLSVYPNSDESGKQSLHPDGDLIATKIWSFVHCQPSLQTPCQSVRKFFRKVANRQTDKQRRKHNLPWRR